MQEIYEKTIKSLQKKQVFGKSATIPGQSISIREMLTRFENGQRIPIHCRPENEFVEADDKGYSPLDERFEDCPEGVDTFEDLMIYQQEHKERTAAFQSHISEQKKKQEEELRKKQEEDAKKE